LVKEQPDKATGIGKDIIGLFKGKVEAQNTLP